MVDKIVSQFWVLINDIFGGSGAEYVRKEIPLYVMPSMSLINLDSPLSSYTDLQHVLFEEERTAYNQAILQNTRLYFINYIHLFLVHI
jgi:BRCA1/BRCA2-containing complex subunit 3